LLEKKCKYIEDKGESNKTIDENKKRIEINKKKSLVLLKNSNEKINNAYKE
jgi:hypothetical protein